MRACRHLRVGEFHYVHHQPDGTPYDEPNAMGEALIAAARDVGLRICLLDTCYLAAGFGERTEGVQRRFDDGDAERWATRVRDLAARHADELDVVIGAAIHSVRAVPREQLAGRRRRAARARRCTSTSPSSRPRTRRASPRPG